MEDKTKSARTRRATGLSRSTTWCSCTYRKRRRNKQARREGREQQAVEVD